MRHLFVMCAILIGVSNTSTSDTNGTFGGNVDGIGLINLGRKLHKPMLTLIGMAIQNLHPCGEWTLWSSCDASRQGYFGSRTRTRSCSNTDDSDEKAMTTENDNTVCEGFCPASYNLTNNGFCLKLNSTKVTNDEAVRQCQQDGGYPIHIDSQQKYDAVKILLIGFTSHVHIDGRRKDASSPWEFMYGSQTEFLNWHSGYPSKNANYMCLHLHINSKLLFNHPCSYECPFLCEIGKA